MKKYSLKVVCHQQLIVTNVTSVICDVCRVVNTDYDSIVWGEYFGDSSNNIIIVIRQIVWSCGFYLIWKLANKQSDKGNFVFLQTD